MKILGGLILAISLHAQTVFPNNWYGAFASYNSTTHPEVSAGAAFATSMQANSGIYSYTTFDLIRQTVPGQTYKNFQSVSATGLAIIRSIGGPFYLGALGTVGAASNGQNASLASSVGGLLIYRVAKTSWTIFAGYRIVDTGALGGSTNVPGFGIGRFF